MKIRKGSRKGRNDCSIIFRRASKSRDERKWEASIRHYRNGKNDTGIKNETGKRNWRGLVVSSGGTLWRDTEQGKWAARVLNYSRARQHAGNFSSSYLYRRIFSERNLSESWSGISSAGDRSTDSSDRYSTVTNVTPISDTTKFRFHPRSKRVIIVSTINATILFQENGDLWNLWKRRNLICSKKFLVERLCFY